VAVTLEQLMEELKKRNLTLDHILEYIKFEDECIQKGYTFKSLIEARDKQDPYKPDPEDKWYGVGKCKCGVVFLDKSTNYCGNCGQRLNWEAVNEEQH
jgi:hypothetical protein